MTQKLLVTQAGAAGILGEQRVQPVGFAQRN